MKRKLLTFFTSLLFILSIMGFTACSDSPVSFKLNFVVDGEIIKTIDTNGQEAISMPQNPSVEGYTFDGWYWDNNMWQRPFTANSLLNEPLTSDMSVYAKFTKNHTHNYSEQVIQPTCTEKGYTLHTCSCGDSYKDTYVNAIGHDYNTPTYVWNGQNCMAMRVCLNDGSHIETETVKGVYIKDTEATCLTPEKGHYKATFFNSAFIEQSTLKDSINNGNSLGHDYKYKNFTWVGYSAKINYECNRDSKHTLSYDAEITNVITLAPTCNATGIRTYIATYGDYSDTKDEILPKIVNEEWDGQSASQNFLYGTGTEINPYLITGPAELVLLRNNVNNGVSYNGMHFKLCCDINLGGNEWTPIGFAADDVNNSFKGEFNGNNYKILNFKTKTIENCVSHGETATCNMGFFGSIENAVVKNLTIDSLRCI